MWQNNFQLDEDLFNELEAEGEDPMMNRRYSLAEIEMLVKDWSAAIRLNRYYGDSLKWNQYAVAINQLLLPFSGLQNVSLGEEAFAQAVSAWQLQQGLTADGIIGPNTWARMKPLLSTGTSYQPSLPAVPSPSPATGLRSAIVNIAMQEWNKWKQGTIKETDPSIQAILRDYWISGTGSDYGYKNKLAWSAAFISWVVKQAGGGNNFRYSGAHTTYTYYAKQNRLQNNSNPFKAYRTSEMKPEPGDIIVQNRGSSAFTYDNLQPDMSGTHGDIVVKVNPATVEVIGGNLSDSVRLNTYPLAANGYLNSPAHFVITKIETAANGKPAGDTPGKAPSYVTPPATTVPPPVQNIFDFNKWHAAKILEAMNAGIVGSNFDAKGQLEKIANGATVLNVNPQTKIIQVLPVMYHITTQARINNYKDIIIGSFIRPPDSSGKCTGHCEGRCIDINYRGGSFETAGAVQMVNTILGYLLSLPSAYKKNLGFGLPLQDGFFGHSSLPKFSSVPSSYLHNADMKKLLPQLGYVFPDNDNHLHIQVKW